MKSLRVFVDRQAGYLVLAATLMLAVVVPVFASAAQLTQRSLALSSSSKAATDVSYNIKFDQVTNAGAVVIQFCTNSPLIGEFCDVPAGIGVETAVAGAGVTAISTSDDATATIKLTKAGATEDLTITGITNPTDAGTVFARILTYADSTAAGTYAVDDTSSVLGSPVDQGAVAIAFTNTVAVSGAVLEALTFCVSGTDLTGTDCATGYSAPVLTLGEDVGDGSKALSPTALSTGNVYTKISTNAIGGAVVSLKSTAGTAGCAGLALNGTGACSIAAAGTTGTFAAGAAKFGLKVTAPASTADGTINLETGYDASDYRLDGTGVTSTYGDPIYNTDGGYANNRNTMLTFGATSANNTPAGKYSTSISLIATGTF